MVERELKLHVPGHARAAVAKEMRKAGARKITLQARYFDTPDRALARAGVALRLRKEGRRWVQTVKAAGHDVLSRTEINHVRPAPELDLSLYAGTPLEPFFGGLKQALALRYETLVSRQLLTVAVGETAIEIAFDQGQVVSASAQLPLCEIEFELIHGDVRHLFDVGGQWLRRHGLVLDLRSKAERGDALADAAGREIKSPVADSDAGSASVQATSAVPALLLPRKALAVSLRNKMPIAQAYALCATECLEQIIRNAAMAAGVDTAQADDTLHMEYVHQLRVGIRRLRSCWKLFKGVAPLPSPNVLLSLKQAFSGLGSSRDEDIVRAVVAPLLRQAGMPAVRLPRRSRGRASLSATIAAGESLQYALLQVLEALVCLPQPAPAAKGESLKPALIKRLDRWLCRICKAGVHFSNLPVEQQHALRKAAKALRYSLDFCQNMLPQSSVAGVRGRLAHIQDVLGELNDFYVASQVYRQRVTLQPHAWFAVGWLGAMQAQKCAQAEQLFVQMSAKPGLKQPHAGR